MNVIKNLNDRDYELLLMIYKYRTLTTRQVKELFFKSSKSYHYRKMYLLKKDGYIGHTRAICKGPFGQKYTSCYFLTNKAIKMLYQLKKISNPIPANDLRVKGWRLLYLVDTIDVYVHLKELGWGLMDSRETKEKFNINRGSFIQGMLFNNENETHMLCVLSHDPKDITVKRLISEIAELSRDIGNVIVLAKTQDGYRDFSEKLKDVIPQLRVDVRIMPYDIGILVLKVVGKSSGREKLFSQYGKIKQVESEVAEYTVMHRGEEKYIVELLSNSTDIKKKLYAYSPLNYKVRGKKVVVLTWRGFVEDLEKEFRLYPHLEFEGIIAKNLDSLLE